MNHSLIVIVVSLAAALLSGCATAPDLIRGLGDDHASVSATIVLPWGTQRVTRINPTTGQTVRVGPDGTIESAGVIAKP